MDALVLLLCCLPDFTRSMVSGKLRKASEKPWTESTWLMEGGLLSESQRGCMGMLADSFCQDLPNGQVNPYLGHPQNQVLLEQNQEVPFQQPST